MILVGGKNNKGGVTQVFTVVIIIISEDGVVMLNIIGIDYVDGRFVMVELVLHNLGII